MVLEDWLVRFVQASIDDAEVAHFVDVVDAEILRTLPELAADAMLVEDLNRSTRHQWLAFLAALGKPEHELALPTQSFDLARSLARRGFEVRVLLRVYLNAHHGVFAYLSDAIDKLAATEPAPDEVLRAIWRRADLWMDEALETLIETFYAERQRELAGSAVRRAELVDEILAGKTVDVAEASATIHHPLHLTQTAFQVWARDVTDETVSTLEAAAETIAKQFENARLMTQLSGSRDLRCWLATPVSPSPQAISALADLHFDGLAVAFGRPGDGLDAFRVSHLEARSAQRLAVAAALKPRFVDYRDVEMLCIALADTPALKRMVLREVGPICHAGKNLAPIRETVLAFLKNRMNVEATAEKLYVHGNTVRYRLAKAEELLGYPLVDRPSHIELALQYVGYFGPPYD